MFEYDIIELKPNERKCSNHLLINNKKNQNMETSLIYLTKDLKRDAVDGMSSPLTLDKTYLAC